MGKKGQFDSVSCCCPSASAAAVAVSIANYKTLLEMRKSGNFFLSIIEYYQNKIGPELKKRFHKNKFCRYHPTCSEYTKEAVRKYGSFLGIVKGAFRIVRCNPFSQGGYDPVR